MSTSATTTVSIPTMASIVIWHMAILSHRPKLMRIIGLPSWTPVMVTRAGLDRNGYEHVMDECCSPMTHMMAFIDWRAAHCGLKQLRHQPTYTYVDPSDFEPPTTGKTSHHWNGVAYMIMTDYAGSYLPARPHPHLRVPWRSSPQFKCRL